MEQRDTPTNLSRYGGLLMFSLITVACFSWFVWSAYNIAYQIVFGSNVVNFDKGSLYMLGAGIGLAALTFAVLYEGVMRRELTKNVTKNITRSALIGVAVMFLLPNLSHYLTSSHLNDKSYIICDEASYQWLFYKKVVYTSNESTCNNLLGKN